MIFEHSGQTVSIARLKANPTALFATAFSIATSSLALIKLKEPAKMSMPPQPARARGSCRLAMFVVFCGNRSEEHTSELQSRENLVCRLLLENKKGTAVPVV